MDLRRVGCVLQYAGRGRNGRYRVEGLTLRIDYDDGSAEQFILIADPKEPNRVIWLDGVSYTSR